MAERSGLLNRRTLTRVPRVRIPVSPLNSAREDRILVLITISGCTTPFAWQVSPGLQSQRHCYRVPPRREGRRARGVTTQKEFRCSFIFYIARNVQDIM